MLGRSRELDLGHGLRSYPVGRYVLFYRFDDTVLALVRVIHSARDLSDHFPPE